MDFLELFDGWRNMEEFEAGTVIYSQDEPGNVMYVILSGDVELTFHGKSLGTETAGGIVGEMAVVNQATRNCTATALTPVRAARLDHEQFKELVDQSSRFALHAMATLANRLRAADRFISERIVNSS